MDRTTNLRIIHHASYMPTPMHAWGAMARPCPCGCRPNAFSRRTLEGKGLYAGIITQASFAPTPPTNHTTTHHILQLGYEARLPHPREVARAMGFPHYPKLNTDLRIALAQLGNAIAYPHALLLARTTARLLQPRAQTSLPQAPPQQRHVPALLFAQ